MTHEKRDRKRRDGQKKLDQLLGGAKKEKGLNPLDLLTSAPSEHRDLINWLARRRQATVAEAADGLGWDESDTRPILRKLKRAGHVRENLKDGERFYRVTFGGRTGKIEGVLPADIWARIDVRHERFLSQSLLFERLDKAEIENVAKLAEVVRFDRGDVIVWQGESVEKVYLLKSGIAGVSILTDEHQMAAQFINYLQQGDVFGEYSLLAGRDVPASATVTAMTAVQLLAFDHDTFQWLLDSHSQVGIGLSRMLTNRLLLAMPKQEVGESNLVLVFGVGSAQVGVGCGMATMLSQDQPAVYTEYPAPHNLISEFDLDYDTNQDFYSAQLGFDIALLRVMPSLPQSVRTTLLLKSLQQNYHNVVIGLPWRIDEAISYLLERANQIVMVFPADMDMHETIPAVVHKIHDHVHPEQTAVFGVATAGEKTDTSYPITIDFKVEENSLAQLSSAQTIADIATDLEQVASSFADRLGRTNQVSVFIPTTVNVNEEVDTGPYVERTMALLGGFFGGATSSQAQGVWNSDEVGLVGETVYIVRSYATKSTLNRHLSEVLAFVEEIKAELSQEAMAVEVNRKLILI